MTAQFRQIMLMVEDVLATVEFYHKGLGLAIKTATPAWAELEANGTTIAIHASHEKPQAGSSPILSFHVTDVYTAIEDLEAMGARLEGQVRQPSFGKVAAVRTPDGHLLSLLEPVDDDLLRSLLQNPQHTET
ncbi:MAG: VOC family protein [Leptolyngbyaceae cyanobacterium SU_3_3]|nr:VOC family protein [Leptolyngbyaceae cyanobacterium SU_3_3]NJR48454.1 VOC family protein [Leptolyngbyaceae cyanobacterium CSU_1_3]